MDKPSIQAVADEVLNRGKEADAIEECSKAVADLKEALSQWLEARKRLPPAES